MLGFLRGGKVSIKPCPLCKGKEWIARGTGEVVERQGTVYLRRYHQCAKCGTRFNLIRAASDNQWSFTTFGAALRA